MCIRAIVTMPEHRRSRSRAWLCLWCPLAARGGITMAPAGSTGLPIPCCAIWKDTIPAATASVRMAGDRRLDNPRCHGMKRPGMKATGMRARGLAVPVSSGRVIAGAIPRQAWDGSGAVVRFRVTLRRHGSRASHGLKASRALKDSSAVPDTADLAKAGPDRAGRCRACPPPRPDRWRRRLRPRRLTKDRPRPRSLRITSTGAETSTARRVRRGADLWRPGSARTGRSGPRARRGRRAVLAGGNDGVRPGVGRAADPGRHRRSAGSADAIGHLPFPRSGNQITGSRARH